MLNDASHDSFYLVARESAVICELGRRDFEVVERIIRNMLAILQPLEKRFEPAGICPDRHVLNADDFRISTNCPLARL